MKYVVCMDKEDLDGNIVPDQIAKICDNRLEAFGYAAMKLGERAIDTDLTLSISFAEDAEDEDDHDEITLIDKEEQVFGKALILKAINASEDY